MDIYKSKNEYEKARTKAKDILKDGGFSDKDADKYLTVCKEFDVWKIGRFPEEVKKIIKDKEFEEAETALDYFICE